MHAVGEHLRSGRHHTCVFGPERPTEDRRAVLEWEKVDIICGVQNLSQRVR
jgi:hypothetical protein